LTKDVGVKKSILMIFAIGLFVIALLGMSASAHGKQFVMGLLLVGPHNDKGWSQAHYEAGKYVEQKVPGVKMIYLDNVNPSGRPGFTIPRLVDAMVAQGAQLIIASSDDMKDGVREAAKKHPGVVFIHVSGDDVWTKKAPPNLGNLMGRMEYPQMMAGLVAAMTTKTGKIGYLGPLINDETRRLTNACYLGAAYAWTKVRKRPISELKFRVSWIGFWFNIPGVTSDPTQVASKFFDSGYDVVISGLDTPEAANVAVQKRKAGGTVWAIPYDYRGACEGVQEICLGVPYFNWAPAYVRIVQSVRDGTWKPSFDWPGPDWSDINNPDTSAVGFLPGAALSPEARAQLDQFIQGLASGELKLFKGPLEYQDGEPFLKAGETASDRQIWYQRRLLQGMEGQSKAR
jgi:simple sugar transport system substrate-binding protein